MEKPSRAFTITIDGEKTTIVMSFALQQELMKVLQSPENVAALLVEDFYLREYIVRRALTGNKRVDSDDDLFDLWEHDIEPDDLDELILWVTDHVLYFFTSTAAKSVKLSGRYKEKMEELTQSAQSLTGSQG